MPRKLFNKLLKPIVYLIIILFLVSTVAPTVASLFPSEPKIVSSNYLN